MSKPIGKPGVDSPNDAPSPGDTGQSPAAGGRPLGSPTPPVAQATRKKKAARPSGIPLPTPRDSTTPKGEVGEAQSRPTPVTSLPPVGKRQSQLTESPSEAVSVVGKDSDFAPGDSSEDAVPSLKDLAARNSASTEVDPEPIRPLEDLHTPERKLVLNDLFDSAPPEGSISLAPPNPTAFWSSKPPAAPSQPPAPAALKGASGKPPKPVEPAPPPPDNLLDAPSSEELPSVDETIPLDLQPDRREQPPFAAVSTQSGVESSAATAEASVQAAAEAELESPIPQAAHVPGSSEPEVAPGATDASGKSGRAKVTTADGTPKARRARQAQEKEKQPAGEAQPTAPAESVASAAPADARPPADLPSVVVAEQRQRAERASKATRIIAIPDEIARAVQASTVARAEASSPRAATHTPNKRHSSLHATRSLWIAAAAMFALAAILIVYRFAVPSTGSLVVTAQGPGGAAVEEVSITIQGVTCGTSPCIISQIAPGEHLLKVSGKGVVPTEDRVLIEAGREMVHNVVLRRPIPPSPRASGTGSLEITEGDEPLTLFLDRKPIGRLPQHVENIPTGKHWLQLKSSDGSEAVARWIKIEDGKKLDLPPVAEPSAFGKVTIVLKPSSRGAAVTLDDAFILDFPAEIELTPGVTHRLSASKAGFRDYSTEIEVEAGQLPEIIEIDLRKGSTRRSRKAARDAKRRRARKKAARKSPKASLGKLTLRSTPPSNVILDGRPIGKTPKLGLEVPGNSLHTIVFVHPSKGRKRAQKYVKAGESESVSVEF